MLLSRGGVFFFADGGGGFTVFFVRARKCGCTCMRHFTSEVMGHGMRGCVRRGRLGGQEGAEKGFVLDEDS